mmetsp:Transcript_31146/g.47138  ORF Transcript_31146/g.47138 Transcript_31146/m.47138 type:complete len:215 (+) Transcript_31146:469-1113(+)
MFDKTGQTDLSLLSPWMPVLVMFFKASVEINVNHSSGGSIKYQLKVSIEAFPFLRHHSNGLIAIQSQTLFKQFSVNRLGKDDHGCCCSLWSSRLSKHSVKFWQQNHQNNHHPKENLLRKCHSSIVKIKLELGNRDDTFLCRTISSTTMRPVSFKREESSNIPNSFELRLMESLKSNIAVSLLHAHFFRMRIQSFSKALESNVVSVRRSLVIMCF